MSTMIETVRAAEAAARKVFGQDIGISIARAPMWGCADVCVIVRGAEHAAAARSFARVVPQARITEVQSWSFPTGEPYTYSTIEWGLAA